MGLRHWGEYDHVLAKSSDAAALIALHETPCSEEEAIKVTAAKFTFVAIDDNGHPRPVDG